MPTNAFSIKPLQVKLLAGEQKATMVWVKFISVLHPSFSSECDGCSSCPAMLGQARSIMHVGVVPVLEGTPFWGHFQTERKPTTLGFNLRQTYLFLRAQSTAGKTRSQPHDGGLCLPLGYLPRYL